MGRSMKIRLYIARTTIHKKNFAIVAKPIGCGDPMIGSVATLRQNLWEEPILRVIDKTQPNSMPKFSQEEKWETDPLLFRCQRQCSPDENS
ncbi:hypothetical protein OUZ56_016632 [Daphnia magna]|uniref:Uncharacterized protein n=1 Tax=Daphnia magna TaxID=35525 RepID=A0ABR0AR80_9CRUS|nr:hypothetical protein OUZ56_016632 [Daphnia magna]